MGIATKLSMECSIWRQRRSSEHERIAMLIGARLVAAVEDMGLGQVFGSPDIDVGLTIRPDAAVVLNAHASVVAEKQLVGPPDLVVEIASPSTAAY